MSRHFNTAGPCAVAGLGLGLERGVLVLFDRRRTNARTPRFLDAVTPSGRAVRLLRV